MLWTSEGLATLWAEIYGRDSRWVNSFDIGNEAATALLRAIETLKPQEQFVVWARSQEHWPYRQAGEFCPRKDGGIGVTRERVRQLEHYAWRKLRHPSRSKPVREALGVGAVL